MSTVEIVFAVIAALPVVLGLVGRILIASASQRTQAVGRALLGAGVDVGRVSRALGDAKRGVPKSGGPL